MRFAVEEAEGFSYKTIHAAGCRDLRSPEELGEAATAEELLALLDGYGSAESLAELPYYMKPCAKKGLR